MPSCLCAPCLFGLEGLVSDELKRMNMSNVRAENGRVLFDGGPREIAAANIRLATAERVTVLLGEFNAESFDALFEGVRALGLENWIPPNGSFPVTGHCLNSKLHSVPDCQRIIKKAAVERLKSKYNVSWFEEDGALYRIRFTVIKDRASIYLDTSGTGLHKRGYRSEGNAAPLRETLAAAMVRLARYRGRGEFCDPFCGSGTIAVEAALAAKNRAPGIGRRFEAESWPGIDGSFWASAREEARGLEYDGDYDIWGGDIDAASVEIARRNAGRAGVGDIIRFEVSDAAAFLRAAPGGTVVSNPPYGERIMERRDAERLYRLFGQACAGLDGWKLCILSSHPDFEILFGRRSTKKRKLYNGMIKCDLFMYF